MGEQRIGKQFELAMQAFDMIDNVAREIVKATGGVHDCNAKDHTEHGQLSSWEKNKQNLIYAIVAVVMLIFVLPTAFTNWYT